MFFKMKGWLASLPFPYCKIFESSRFWNQRGVVCSNTLITYMRIEKLILLNQVKKLGQGFEWYSRSDRIEVFYTLCLKLSWNVAKSARKQSRFKRFHLRRKHFKAFPEQSNSRDSPPTFKVNFRNQKKEVFNSRFVTKPTSETGLMSNSFIKPEFTI